LASAVAAASVDIKVRAESKMKASLVDIVAGN
jgi:hypothetical protein